MAEFPGDPDASFPPRPLPATYWVVPGRLLVGEHPGSQSRADAMERLRRFLVAGITCFVDLTEPDELPSYEALLPFATPEGRRVEYLREPIRDHGVPCGPEPVARVIAMIDDALEAGHVVYLHCRAGIGRSATLAACWLATRGAAPDPLDELQALWQQSERSRRWPMVPETEEQAEFVRQWSQRRRAPGRVPASLMADRIRGALYGLALGDATGASRPAAAAVTWTQHTSLALCLAESLLESGTCDARDQIRRYVAWQREGHLSATGAPGRASPDVARALATYLWRGVPMAGSHDPADRSTSSLSRVVSAVAFAVADPAEAVALAAECSRTTHQSPVVLDACRYYAALLIGALSGESATTLCNGIYEPVAGLWESRPLRAEVVAALMAQGAAPEAQRRARPPDVVQAVVNVRAAVAAAGSAIEAIRLAIRDGREPALDGALAGALAGALWGASGLPAPAVSALAGRDLIDGFAVRFAGRFAPSSARASEVGP
jgi:ADP-ribosylglycohydrolase/protein-tyrosine phosphatase